MDAPRFHIDPSDPAPSIMDRAADIITGGGVVIFPTQSLYGLGGNALDPQAVDRIFQVKERPGDKPVLVLIGQIIELQSLVEEISPVARQIMHRFWPGGVTLVCHAAARLPSNLTAGTGKIGVRMPIHPVARQLVRRAGVPVTGTSANLSGRPAGATISSIDPPLLRRVDMILDAGELIGGAGSTIVDVTTSPPTILREGIVPAWKIEASICATGLTHAKNKGSLFNR